MRCRTTGKDVIDQVYGIGNGDNTISVRVAVAIRIRRRTTGENVIDQEHGVGNGEDTVAVRIATLTAAEANLAVEEQALQGVQRAGLVRRNNCVKPIDTIRTNELGTIEITGIDIG